MKRIIGCFLLAVFLNPAISAFADEPLVGEILLEAPIINQGSAIVGRVILENISNQELELTSYLSPRNQGFSFELMNSSGVTQEIKSVIHLQRSVSPSLIIEPGVKIAIPFFLLKAEGEFVTESEGAFSMNARASISFVANGSRRLMQLVTEEVKLEVVAGMGISKIYKDKFFCVYECLDPFSINFLPKDLSWLFIGIEEYLPQMNEATAYQMGGWKILKLLRENGGLESKEMDDLKIVDSFKAINEKNKIKSSFFEDLIAGAVINGNMGKIPSSYHQAIMAERGVLYFE